MGCGPSKQDDRSPEPAPRPSTAPTAPNRPQSPTSNSSQRQNPAIRPGLADAPLQPRSDTNVNPNTTAPTPALTPRAEDRPQSQDASPGEGIPLTRTPIRAIPPSEASDSKQAAGRKEDGIPLTRLSRAYEPSTTGRSSRSRSRNHPDDRRSVGLPDASAGGGRNPHADPDTDRAGRGRGRRGDSLTTDTDTHGVKQSSGGSRLVTGPGAHANVRERHRGRHDLSEGRQAEGHRRVQSEPARPEDPTQSPAFDIGSLQGRRGRAEH